VGEPSPVVVKAQTGAEQWLQKMLNTNPEFKKEYEKALEEIREYDRQEREKEALAKKRKPS
jgi:hypothetical protein